MAANRFRQAALALLGLCLVVPVAVGAERAGGLKEGKPDLKSAGPLAFGPDGILFVGDTAGAALYAIDTGDKTESKEKAKIEVKDVSGTIAQGARHDTAAAHDQRPGGEPAFGQCVPVGVTGPRAGRRSAARAREAGWQGRGSFARERSRSRRPRFPMRRSPDARGRGPSPRSLSITDLSYSDGRVFVAGLSNEEFSSRLIAIPYPFSSEGIDGAGIEIYHGAHGKLETKSPIRTFVTYKIGGEPYMLAAYQCTPLVKIAVSELKAGAHVKGTTIAELGNRNNPLDMIVYQKDGKDYLLMTNSSRGVMKIPTEGAGAAPGITEPVPGGGTKGLGYEKIESLKGVQQMDQLDATHAVILVKAEGAGPLSLETIELP